MSLKSIFESRGSRLVLVGLFLALLELVRAKLVWAKQPKSSNEIYLRPLTDEPAEQAVQKAILALADTESEDSAQTQTRQEPPIPISELPPKHKPTVSPPAQKQQQPPIPITELPSKDKPAAVPEKQEEIR